MKQILDPTTAAGDSLSFTVPERGEATLVMHAAAGLVTAQYANVQISHDRALSWADLYRDGSQVRLTRTNNALTIYGPGTFRVSKEATTNPAGISLATNADL